MAVKLHTAHVQAEEAQPFFFSSPDNFKTQAPKPKVCGGCPLHAAPYAWDDPPPPPGTPLTLLCILPFPFWADVQFSEKIPGWKKGTVQDNPALEGPFKSRNWWLYQKIISTYKKKYQITIHTTYATMCRSTGNPSAACTKHCATYFLKQKIAQLNPKVILAFGSAAAKGLGYAQALKDLRGTIRTYTQPGFSCRTIFTHDPSNYFFSKDDYELLSTFILDLEKAIHIAIHGYAPVDWDAWRATLRFPKTEAEILQLLQDIRAEATGAIAFDTETMGLDPRAPDAKVTVLSFGWGENKAAAFPFVGISADARKACVDLLADPSIKKIAHNAKFDVGYLLGAEKIHVEGLVADTMLNQQLIDENRGGSDDSVGGAGKASIIKGEFTLKKLVWDYLWEFGGYEELGEVSKKIKKGGTATVDMDMLLFYAALDALVTWKLNRIQVRLLVDQPPNATVETLRQVGPTELYRFSRTFIPASIMTLAEIENHGIHLDIPLLHKMIADAELLQHNAEEAFLGEVEKAGFPSADMNIRSNKDLQDLLFTKLKLPINKKTKTGAASTDASVLEELGNIHPVTTKLLDYRQVEKLLKAFLINWRDSARDGKIYPSYRLGVAKTGRTSCTSPNVQQVPREDSMLDGFNLKRLFIPRPGFDMLHADYSQQEVRILASYCGEGKLLEALQANLDIHSFTAGQIFNIPYEEMELNKKLEPYKSMRKKAKNVTFSMVYGGTAFTLKTRYQVEEEEGEELIELFYEKFPEIRKYVDASHKMAMNRKYVTSCFARRRRFPILHWKRGDKRALRQAQNSRIQSTGSDITIGAVMYLQQELRKINASVLLTVHDSIISEVPRGLMQEAIKIYADGMIHRPAADYPWLKAPLVIDVDVGKSWGELHELGGDPAKWSSQVELLGM